MQSSSSVVEPVDVWRGVRRELGELLGAGPHSSSSRVLLFDHSQFTQQNEQVFIALMGMSWNETWAHVLIVFVVYSIAVAAYESKRNVVCWLLAVADLQCQYAHNSCVVAFTASVCTFRRLVATRSLRTDALRRLCGVLLAVLGLNQLRNVYAGLD
jgi:hypothetical protein